MDAGTALARKCTETAGVLEEMVSAHSMKRFQFSP